MLYTIPVDNSVNRNPVQLEEGCITKGSSPTLLEDPMQKHIKSKSYRSTDSRISELGADLKVIYENLLCGQYKHNS
jgi:hypothetical protein